MEKTVYSDGSPRKILDKDEYDFIKRQGYNINKYGEELFSVEQFREEALSNIDSFCDNMNHLKNFKERIITDEEWYKIFFNWLN